MNLCGWGRVWGLVRGYTWITVFRVVFGGWIGMWVEQSDLVDGLMDGWMA